MATDDNTTVSFRLTPEAHEELVREAESAGTTKHQLARILLIRALEAKESSQSAPDLSAFEEAFEGIRAEFGGIRIALGRSVDAILRNVAPKMPPDEIRKWIFEKIISVAPPPREEDEEQH